jgi:hypothetical protein
MLTGLLIPSVVLLAVRKNVKIFIMFHETLTDDRKVLGNFRSMNRIYVHCLDMLSIQIVLSCRVKSGVSESNIRDSL